MSLRHRGRRAGAAAGGARGRLSRRVAAGGAVRARARLQRNPVVAARRATLRQPRRQLRLAPRARARPHARSTCATTAACRSRRTAAAWRACSTSWSASGRCRSRSWCWSATAWAASSCAAPPTTAPRARGWRACATPSTSARRTAERRWRRRPTPRPGCSACRTSPVRSPRWSTGAAAASRTCASAPCATRTGTGAEVDALLDDRTADLPLLDGANHYFIAATLTRDRHHPLGIAVGDLLVRPASAFGRVSHTRFPLARGHHVGAMNHLDLLNHSAVYEQIAARADGHAHDRRRMTLNKWGGASPRRRRGGSPAPLVQHL